LLVTANRNWELIAISQSYSMSHYDLADWRRLWMLSTVYTRHSLFFR